MRVLVHGADEYIGTRLVSWLSRRGHAVVSTDGHHHGSMSSDALGMPTALGAGRSGNAGWLPPAAFDGIDAIVHLAETPTSPAAVRSAAARLAQVARAARVRRFIYLSSFQVYGDSADGTVNEQAPVHPQTDFARSKAADERELLAMSDDSFAVAVLRAPNAYGPSPNMRFDLVLNGLCALAWTTRRISLRDDGSKWTPVAHVEDICEAIRCCLDAPVEVVASQTFNVGREGENYRLAELAAIVAREVTGCVLARGTELSTRATHGCRMSFAKINSELPGFSASWSAAAGVAEQIRLLTRIESAPAAHEFRAFARLTQLRSLMLSGQISSGLFWHAG